MKNMINNNEIEQACCNRCGHPFKYENGIAREDFFSAEKVWGYFSKKDLEHHSFNLCEKCYDEITKEFVIPVNTKEETEAL